MHMTEMITLKHVGFECKKDKIHNSPVIIMLYKNSRILLNNITTIHVSQKTIKVIVVYHNRYNNIILNLK